MDDWNGREIAVAKSKGGVLAVVDFAENLIRVDDVPWPPPTVVQKLYESRQARAFLPDSLEALTKRLGVYSDLQSVHSEDAVTWSYFGPLAIQGPEPRARFLEWLLHRLDLGAWTGSSTCSIDLWRRIPHPDKSLPGGPELDFVIDGEACVVFGEVKWRSGEGRKQGIKKDKGQLQLRRDFFARYGKAIYGDRRFLVLGISLGGPLEATTPPDEETLVTRTLSWNDLGEYADHPKCDEVRRYLRWKEAHSLPD